MSTKRSSDAICVAGNVGLHSSHQRKHPLDLPRPIESRRSPHSPRDHELSTMLGYPDCATLVRIRIVSNPFHKGRSASSAHPSFTLPNPP
jgi:hypothetical protein